MMNSFTFIKGEVRKITYELTCKEDKNFEISTATVEIIKYNDIVEKLDVQISNHQVEFIVDTNNLNIGTYKLMITCHINEEILKNKINMEITN